jgi:hypothetical protein
MPTVTLAGKPFDLRLPDSYSDRRDAWSAAGEHWVRGICASLAMCLDYEEVGDKRLRPHVSFRNCRCNALVFGGAYLDRLVGMRIPEGDVFAAGATAWRFLSDSFPTEEEVKAAEATFQGPPGESVAVPDR